MPPLPLLLPPRLLLCRKGEVAFVGYDVQGKELLDFNVSNIYNYAGAPSPWQWAGLWERGLPGLSLPWPALAEAGPGLLAEH